MNQTIISDDAAEIRKRRILQANASAKSGGRPKLYLIDHSLTNIGGHHFDSARLLLQAAIELGLEPVLAANRRLRDREGLPAGLTILPLFKHTVYNSNSATAGSATSPSDPLGALSVRPNATWWRKLSERWTHWRQRQQALAFAAACREVFRQVPPAPGDQVFIPTLSEFDLVGLSEFLRTDGNATPCEWHLQFHYPFLKGPAASFDSQSARHRAMRAHFSSIASRAGQVLWHFYAPTNGLVEQYASLGIVPFQLLEHPVDSKSELTGGDETSRQNDAAGPLRVLCAGGLRADKGSSQLRELLKDLERDNFAAGAIQLWVQAKRPGKLKRIAGNHKFMTLDPSGALPPNDAKLVHVPHPLPTDAYVRLLRRADVGLLAYDSNFYSVRCSGVLVELLAAGIPVIVPENTWLAEELKSAGDPTPGIIASGPAGFAASLREMAKQRSQYRQRALSAAPNYARRHSAQRVIEQLLSSAPARAAA